jgi:hypothetical protein
MKDTPGIGGHFLACASLEQIADVSTVNMFHLSKYNMVSLK